MELKYRLLNHPFYQAWNEGKVELSTLGMYSKSYLEVIEQMPIFWEKIFRSFGIDNKESRSIIRDEEYHVDLWKMWSNEFACIDTFPSLKHIKAQFMQMTPSELLGAVQAFEIQQPEVAKTKREGLVKHYGFEREKLKYFDEHEKEDVHIAFGQRLANEHANRAEYERGFERGQKIVYASLDAFVQN